MAGRDPLHQRSNAESGLVPNLRTFRLPLLPYERQLIEMLGISREEYEQFVEQTWRASRTRPAEYANIPDIRCDPSGGALTTALVSLAIGLATTAVSYFLTPKPKTQNQPKFRTIDLANINGQDRFAPSFGFESQQEIATYGTPIPLIFTKQSPDAANGLLISPQLVWSRILSRGAYQIIELQYLVGQGPVSLRGDWPGGNFGNLFFGNNTIDTGALNDYAFFYSDGSSTDNTLGTANLLSGSLMADIEPFKAPSRGGDRSNAFCSSFTPTNQVQFGVYSPIANGTSLRLNWQVVALNLNEDIKDKDYTPLHIRNWISGVVEPTGGQTKKQAMIASGMDGTGANYARRTGVWSTNASSVIAEINGGGSYVKAKIYRADIGTELTVAVGVKRQRLNLEVEYEGTENTSNQGEEIRNTLEGEHSAQDAALQVGEQFIIGTGLWQVTRRQQLGDAATDTREGYWHLESKPSDLPRQAESVPLLATLKCVRNLGGIAITGGLQPIQFGIPHQDVISETAKPYLGISENNGKSKGLDGKDYILDEAFFPICKAAIATVQNTRPCEVTEIGIKSQVWLRYSNICNFATIPSPATLKKAEEKGTSYQTGTINSYDRRVSLFSVDIRFAGASASDEWSPLGETFAVVGDTPTDQFNYIRINNPLGKPLEFRMRPRTSADAVYINGPDWNVIVLDASRNEVYSWKREALGSSFDCTVNGRKVAIGTLWSSKRMGMATTVTASVSTKTPSDISLVKYQYRAGTGGSGSPSTAEISDVWRFMLAYRKFAGADLVTSPPMDITTGSGKNHYERANPNEYASGVRFTVREAYRPSGPDNVYIDFTIQTVYDYGSSQMQWQLISTDVVSAGTGFNIGDTFFKGLIRGYVGATSAFRTPILEAVFKVENVVKTAGTSKEEYSRIFERYTALAEVTHYSSLIQRSCDSNPEHQIVYINESLQDPVTANYSRCAMAGLRLRSGSNFSNLDQFRMFATQGLKVQTLPADGSAGTVTSSNLFNEFANYLITNTETGAGVVASGLVDDAQMRRCTKFLTTNKLFFNDVVTDPVNIRSYLGDIAPSMLCALVIRNGRFSIEPALPVIESSGAISPDRVPIAAMFTSGNILEGSFSVDYLGAEERKDFTAVVRWRQSFENEFPQLRAFEAYYSDVSEPNRPIEEFDLRWVTNESHAQLAARYFLAIRRRVTHTVRFKTTPLGSTLLPGSYIIVNTDSNPYTPLNNGIVLPSGKIVSAKPLTSSATPVNVIYWERGAESVRDGTMVIEAGADGVITTKAPRDVIFSIRSLETRDNCYMVEAITLDEDGMVEVVASHFPLDSDGRSVIARDILGLGTTSITGSSL